MHVHPLCRRFVAVLLIALFHMGLSLVAMAETPAKPRLVVDLARSTRPLRPLHGANFGPLCANGIVDLSSYQRQLRLPSTRLHDIPWTYSEVVDVHSLFRDFRADPAVPANYDFRRTDDYLIATTNTGTRILYRLGESIEHTPVKYWVHPPSNPDKWAQICLQILRHYNEGWANGFHHGIQDWEIWNEPENQPACWTGSNAAYVQLYATTAHVIKRAFPSLHVGGPAVGNSGEIVQGVFKPSAFVTQFLAACRDQNLPLDFFSWHLYTDDLNELEVRARGIRQLLDAYGFEATRSYLDEWNYLPNRDWSAFDRKNQGPVRDRFFEAAGGTDAAAFVASFLIRLQGTSVDLAHFFSADNQGFGLFTANGTPRKTFYAFQSISDLAALPKQVPVQIENADGLDALAATDPGSGITRVLLSNRSPQPQEVLVQWKNTHAPPKLTLTQFVLGPDAEPKTLAPIEFAPALAPTRISVPGPGICRLELHPQ